MSITCQSHVHFLFDWHSTSGLQLPWNSPWTSVLQYPCLATLDITESVWGVRLLSITFPQPPCWPTAHMYFLPSFDTFTHHQTLYELSQVCQSRGKHTTVEVARSEIENCFHSQKPDAVQQQYPWRNFILSTLPIAISPMCRKHKNLPSPGTSIIQCLAGPEAVTLMGSTAKGTLLPPTCVIFSRDYVLMFRACL